MIKVTLLGAGNVGFHLYKAIDQADGVEVMEWYNRSLTTLKPYKEKVSITDQLSTLKEADIYLISVSDNAIDNISHALKDKKGIVAHTAGSVSIKTLHHHKSHGVFYPLQTFSKSRRIDFREIPLCIEASNDEVENILYHFAEALGSTPHLINSEQRKALHLAAVFVNNFSNHLFTIGEELCSKNHLPFSILQPLIKETVDKLNYLSPKEAQTGPALRKDQLTINRHLEDLQEDLHQQLYTILSSSIQQKHE